MAAFFFGGSCEEVVFWFLASEKVDEFDGGIIEEVLGERVHAVFLVRRDQGVGEHSVEKGAFRDEAVRPKNGEVEFEIMTYFEGPGGKDRDEFLTEWRPIGDREIVGVVGYRGKCETNQPGRKAVERVRFDIETKRLRLE